MAFAGEYIQLQELQLFSFFATGGANGAASESLALGKRIMVNEIRLTWSTAFASVADLIIKLSSGKGSQYNHKFVSQALNTIQHLLYIPSCSTYMESTDHLNMTFNMASGTNTWGLQVVGWSVEE